MTSSATLDAVDTSRYAERWRALPRELGYHLVTLPIVVVAFSVLITLFNVGVSLIVVAIGLPILTGFLYAARAFGTLELRRLEAARMPSVPRPHWPVSTRTGVMRLIEPLGNGRYWIYALHGMVVNFAVGTFTWSVMISWLATGLGGISYWFWTSFIPRENSFYLSEVVSRFLVDAEPPLDGRTGDNILYFVVGVVFTLTLPLMSRALLRLHHAIARGMLGPWRSDELERRVVDLNASRGAAVAAEGHSLRRLERDIHDGPQQRLIRLQMDLASAERELERDPEAARARISEAAEQSRAALDELRALSRGFAPPLLLDRGLIAALESLASRNPTPVSLTSTIDRELPQEVERNAYFIASELVTNATKHSGASEIALGVSTRREGDAPWLVVAGSDDGRGGAAPAPGHGLEGVEERLRGLGGALELSSPAGGPTVVTARIPLEP